jgi:hypothetical protein
MGSRPFQPIMVPHNAVSMGGTPKAKSTSETMARNENGEFVFTGDANLSHTPAFWVRIWNVSDMEQRIERPWVMPGHAGKIIVIPARAEGETISQPFFIPDIVQLPVFRPGSSEINTRGVDGKFLAQDALNPEDMRGSWKTVRTVLAASLANEGTNLYWWGLFWDRTKGPDKNDSPDQEAAAKAVERLETNYNRLIDEANIMALNPKTVGDIGHTHRRAANYFGRSFTWNMRYEKQNPCPNCGQSLPATASRCYQCKRVINTEQALAEGTLTREEAIAMGMIANQVDAMAKKPRGKKAATP